jgi:NAD(P)-dependent dehydrogenase (short-subunit alcohol dehydrogenase family)
MSYSSQQKNHSNALAQRRIDGAGFGKVAIITGCASGVGLATTQVFLSHQYEVLGVDAKDMDYSLIDGNDQDRFHFHRGDLTQDGECDEVVRICVGKFGCVDSSLVIVPFFASPSM